MTEQQFQLLADCIRSEQVPRIMEENREFAAWYAERYIEQRNNNVHPLS